MNEYEEESQEFDVDYYILDSLEVARITCDPATGDNLVGEILVGNRYWEEYPMSAIFGEGDLVSRSEAKKCAKKSGLHL